MTPAIYEVNLTLTPEISQDYDRFLETHIPEVLAASGFSHAERWEVSPARTDAVCWVIHYHAESRAQIEAYLQNHAPRLRADAVQRFGNRFQAERRILVRSESKLPRNLRTFQN